MPTRRKRGRVVATTTPQRTDQGRPSRARGGVPVQPHRLQVDGTLAGHALAIGVELASLEAARAAGEDTQAASKRLRRRRGEARKALGVEVARHLEQRVRLVALDVAALALVGDVALRRRLAEAFKRGLAAADEHGLTCTAAVVASARAERLAGIGDALLDASLAAEVLDVDRLRVATSLVQAARLERLGAFESERQVRARRADVLPVGTLAELLEAASRDARGAAQTPAGEAIDAPTTATTHGATNGAPRGAHAPEDRT